LIDCAWLKKSFSMSAPLAASLKMVIGPLAAHSRRSAWLKVTPPDEQKLVPWSSPVAQLRWTLSL
jgi:hypothetical protein